MKKLLKLNTQSDAAPFLKSCISTQGIWNRVERANWLLGLLAAVLPKQQAVLLACACARTVLKYVPQGEERPRIAIETAERWARGQATLQEVKDVAFRAANAAFAADAADAAAYAANAASYAAYAASYAASHAANAANAANAAYVASAANAADGENVRKAAHLEMTGIIKGMLTIEEFKEVLTFCAHCGENQKNHSPEGLCLFGPTRWIPE